MTRTTIDNRADLIDSRDITDRITELDASRAWWIAERADAIELEEHTPEWRALVEQWAAAHPDEAAEFAVLDALASEASQYTEDWRYGVTLIRDSYFAEYVEELLQDCGYLPHDLPWYVVIDWDATARHVQQDYAEIDFDGVSYWVR